MTPHDGHQAPLMGIFGSGRSGSTWLGAIVSSHPDIVYRFEPLHRLAGLDARVRELRGQLSTGQFGPDMLGELYAALLRARPEVEKPPFFAKRDRGSRQLGRSVLWPLARRSATCARAFERLYTPRARPPLVFKEVTSELIMANLLARTAMRVVYLVRHPCGVAHSTLAGQRRGLMPSDRRRVLGDTIRRLDPELPRRLGFDLERATPIEIEALCWRLDAEIGLAAARASANAHIVVYEDLCADPLGVAQGVLGHFGLALTPATRQFIDRSMHGSGLGKLAYGEVGVDAYFSVFRDPRATRDRWRHELTADDQARVLHLVEDSPAFQCLFGRGKQAAAQAACA